MSEIETETSTATVAVVAEKPKMDVLTKTFHAARRVATPLIAVNTPDPAATVEHLSSTGTASVNRFQWDIIEGIRAIGKHSAETLRELCPTEEDQATTCSPVVALQMMSQMPMKSIMFFQSAHRFIHEREVAQAIWNLREENKRNIRTLVLLSPQIKLPAELQSDILVLDEELPTDERLSEVVNELITAATLDSVVTDEQRKRSIDAMRGLALYPAEQSLAMSLNKDTGIDTELLWERKRKTIEATPGLKINRSNLTFDDLGGLSQIKKFTQQLFSGNHPPTCIVRIDEIEKSLGNTSGDTSGTSQDALGVILREMQDNNWRGLIAMGFPGTGKSAVSKAMGNMGGVPTIELDLGSMKGSLVGESEGNVRSAFKVIRSMAGDGAFFVATCNDVAGLKPELIRRFPYGRWFFDLPLGSEWNRILEMYASKYGLSLADTPSMEGWTGAEIEIACEMAHRQAISIAEASEYVVPFSKAEPDTIGRLRAFANNRFLNASAVGTYEAPVNPNKASVNASRSIDLELDGGV